MNPSPLDSSSSLVRQLLAIPPALRGAAMQSVVSFRPETTLEGSFNIGALRASFADVWEHRFQTAMPILTMRGIMSPPVPIEIVLEFSKLNLAADGGELTQALFVLTDFLWGILSENHSAQLTFLEATQDEAHPVLPRAPVARVKNLKSLIDSGEKFPTIYADPPWRYANTASRAAAENHYATMSVEEICSEPVADLAAIDAHLHLWTTNAFLRSAFDVMDAWGFQFKSCLVWVKPDIGMGNYWRVSHEFLLLGVRGRLTFRDRTRASWIQTPRTRHSRKPGVVRTLIESVSPGPYLELYGREELPNSAWTVYGDQIEPRLF